MLIQIITVQKLSQFQLICRIINEPRKKRHRKKEERGKLTGGEQHWNSICVSLSLCARMHTTAHINTHTMCVHVSMHMTRLCVCVRASLCAVCLSRCMHVKGAHKKLLFLTIIRHTHLLVPMSLCKRVYLILRTSLWQHEHAH